MVFYHLAVLLWLVWTFGFLCWNLSQFRSLKPVAAPSADKAPFISVLVPARNEEHRIGACAGSLACQQYPNFEVIVLDDNSEDATAEVLRGLGFQDTPGARLRVISGSPLPPGWTGKGWACHQLAQAARGEYLLFTDADTQHAPHMLASALALVEETQADLLSAWPKLLMLTWSEKLVLPMIHLAMAFYPHALLQWLQASPGRAKRWTGGLPDHYRRGFGAANGQFIWFRRTAYERIGGHESVRSHMVEDVALGRAVAQRINEGMRLVNCDGAPVAEVRMYTRFSEVWEGFTKNIRAAFESSLGMYLGFGLLTNCTLLLPFVWIWSAHGVQWKIVAAQIAMIIAIRIALAIRLQSSWVGVLLHPVGQVLGTAIALNSWRRSAGKGVTWKGRTYEVVHPQP